eukprot:s1085_g2.t1
MGRVKGTIQPVQSGVLVDKSEGPVACFGEYAPQDAVRAWGSAKAAKQLNFEAEDMPFVSALNCWSQALQDCSLLVFIDNDAARHAWVSASALTAHAANMIHHGLVLKSSLSVAAYFAEYRRTPT